MHVDNAWNRPLVFGKQAATPRPLTSVQPSNIPFNFRFVPTEGYVPSAQPSKQDPRLAHPGDCTCKAHHTQFTQSPNVAQVPSTPATCSKENAKPTTSATDKEATGDTKEGKSAPAFHVRGRGRSSFLPSARNTGRDVLTQGPARTVNTGSVNPSSSAATQSVAPITKSVAAPAYGNPGQRLPAPINITGTRAGLGDLSRGPPHRAPCRGRGRQQDPQATQGGVPPGKANFGRQRPARY
jgi:hypothetical protein